MEKIICRNYLFLKDNKNNKESYGNFILNMFIIGK